MAEQKNLQIWGSLSYKKGSGTLAANRMVKLSSGLLEPVSATTDVVIGAIVDTTAETDIPVPVITEGVVPMEVGTAGVTENTYVKIDSVGRVVDSALANADKVVGIALETVASGGLAEVLLKIQGMPAS